MNRRSFLSGLGALVTAGPTLAGGSVSPGISLRGLTEYVAADGGIGGFDIFYGYMEVRPEWLEIAGQQLIDVIPPFYDGAAG